MVIGQRSRSVASGVRLVLVFAALALYGERVPTQSLPVYGIYDPGTLGGPASAAHGIGEYGGLIAGRSQVAGGGDHAFIDGHWGRRDLGTLGGATSVAFAAEGSEVVGQAQTAAGEEHAFLVSLAAPGAMQDLGTLGGSWSAAYDVRGGIVVGASRVAGNARLQAFEYRNGRMTAIPVPGTGDSAARGANAAGDIVGYACASAGSGCRAFLRSAGVTTALGTLGGSSTAEDVNAGQQVVGTSAVANGATRAFLYANQAMMDLGTLGGASSEGLAINDAGAMVGRAQNAAGAWRAFVWQNGRMADLNDLVPAGSGWVLQAATGISEGGQIVGYGAFNGSTRAFLLTPAVDLIASPFGIRSNTDGNLPRGVQVGRTVRFVTSAAANGEPITVYGATMTHTLTGPAEFVSWYPDQGDVCEKSAPSVVICRLGVIDGPGIGREHRLEARATGPGEIVHSARLSASSAPELNTGNNVVEEQNWAVALASLVLTPSTIAGGRASAAHVTLTDPVPGGATVTLRSSRPDIAPVPATFIVPFSVTRAFNIVPAVVSAPTPVEITATYGLVTARATLLVVPPAIQQLYLTPTTVVGGCGVSTGKVLLTGSAPPGGAVVPLSNTNPSAVVPSSVTVPAGAMSRTFTIPTQPRISSVNGNVTASFGGLSQALRLTVRPIRARTVALSPSSARGGATVLGTITLVCPAAPGPVVASLTSSHPSLAAPATPSVTIPAGVTTAAFSIRTSPVPVSTNVSINVWVFGVRKTAVLTLTP